MVLDCLSRIIHTCYCVLSAFRDGSYSTLKVLGIHFDHHLHTKTGGGSGPKYSSHAGRVGGSCKVVISSSQGLCR